MRSWQDAASPLPSRRESALMAIIVATLLLFLAGPFVLWPLLKTPPE
jgi:hypothetical protein